MDYGAYARTQREHDAREDRKRPGRKFCDDVGWRITMNGYEEIRRPDKITHMGGSIIRTYTPVYDVWYRNTNTGEHVLIEFNGMLGIHVKRNVKVTSSPGRNFNSVMLNINPDNYSECRHFNSNNEAADYLVRSK
ncbi:MAG: hypothetical protein ACXABD_00620 [Candidatus Thorarchaeota archaeon]